MTSKTFWPQLLVAGVFSVFLDFISIELLIGDYAMKVLGSIMLGAGIASTVSVVQLLLSRERYFDIPKWLFSGYIGAITGLICSITSIFGLRLSEEKSIPSMLAIICSFEALGGALSFLISKLIANKVNGKMNHASPLMTDTIVGAASASLGALVS